MRMLKQILIATGVSWCGSVLLGLIFAMCRQKWMSQSVLQLPGVLPVMLFISTVIAILLIPLVWWALKSGAKDLVFHFVALFFLLLVWIVLTPLAGERVSAPLGLYGSVLLGIIGLIVIGFIHR